MKPDQIKHMVSRFLGWRLPENFRPDAGISFSPEFNVEYNAKRRLPPQRHEPTGTNLFDYQQAESMVRHMIEGMPQGSHLLDETAAEMLADYITSEQHHPDYVLAPTSAFNKLRDWRLVAEGTRDGDRVFKDGRWQAIGGGRGKQSDRHRSNHIVSTDNPHLVDGDFQSDKYPTTPRGKVPLSTKDPMAQDLLWQYAKRRRAVDADFADGLVEALRLKGYVGDGEAPLTDDRREEIRERDKELRDAITAIRKAMKPFVIATDAVEAMRDRRIEDNSAYIAGNCEDCSKLLLDGDLGHRCEDGPLMCEACAPTWNEMRRQYDEDKARGGTAFEDRFETAEAAAQADGHVDERIAAGDGHKKWVWPL